MRLTAQMRGGFYPAHEKAIAHAARSLRPPASGSFFLLDPCAGRGAAIRQLAELLGCSAATTYAIELDEDRAESLHATLPDAHVLAPASFLGCRAAYNGFSFVWLNPPFDAAYGGHRVEDQFLRTATDWLMPRGVMAFVCPKDVVDDYSDARRHLVTYFENCTIVPFPEEHRPFREVVVFGHKRARPAADHRYGGSRTSWEDVQAPDGFLYHIPPGAGPRTSQKVEPTEPELQGLLARSPLRNRLTAPPPVPLPSPPLSLAVGHVALLLAAGHLDGVVHPESEPPHVVRGTARKRAYVADVSETELPDGSVATRTTVAERIDLVVRTVDISGRIHTFTEHDDHAA